MNLVLRNRNHFPSLFNLDFFKDFDPLFEAGWPKTSENKIFQLAVDIKENEKNYELIADLPGLTKEDVKIEVKDNLLTISGEKKHEATEEAKGYRRIERSYGHFERSFQLPEGIDVEQVQAKFEDGTLRLQVPKPEKIIKSTKVIDIN